MKSLRFLSLITMSLCQATKAQDIGVMRIELEDGPVWKRHVVDDTSLGADGAKLGDINGDGLPDVVTGWEEGGAVRLYLNPGAIKARTAWPHVTVGQVRDAEDAILIDLQGDGRLSIISCTEGNTRSVFLHRYIGSNDFTRGNDDLLSPERWTTSVFPATAGKQAWMQAVAMDVDEQNGADVILASKGKGGAIGWLQAPKRIDDLAAWHYRPLREAGWIMSLLLHDMDADGDSDLVFTDRKGPRGGVYWLENPGVAAVRKHSHWTEHPIGAEGREVMFADIADINNDGRSDVIAAVKPADVVLFLQQSEYTWQQERLSLVAEDLGDAKAAKCADLNADGLNDLVFTCENARDERTGIVWLEQQSSGVWKQHPLGGPAGVKFDMMQFIDLDHDGDLDVLSCEERDQLGVIWYENPHYPMES